MHGDGYQSLKFVWDNCMLKFCMERGNIQCKLQIPTYSHVKKCAWGCIGICGDAWGCMGIGRGRCKLFYGDQKNEIFCVLNAWGHPQTIFLRGDHPHANFLHWNLRGADLCGSVIQGSGIRTPCLTIPDLQYPQCAIYWLRCTLVSQTYLYL